jgi:hypothetical protein
MSTFDWKHADPGNGLHIMRKAAAQYLRGVHATALPASCLRTDVYQFGVWCGYSLYAIQCYWLEAKLPIRKLFALVSFEGLPAEQSDRYVTKDWFPGNFSAIHDLRVATVDEAIASIKSRLRPEIDTVFVPGYWDQVLRPELVQQCDMKPAAYVDIDCDLYGSAKLALQFMCENKLIVAGTLIGYHDWNSTVLWKEGESRAHQEICEQFGLKCEQIFDNGANPVFHVLTIS